VIRLRALPVSDAEASELARRLRAHGGASVDVAERLERAFALGTGLIGTDTTQARAVLAVIEERNDDRLEEIEVDLRRFVSMSN
jgi:hypothetical protein